MSLHAAQQQYPLQPHSTPSTEDGKTGFQFSFGNSYPNKEDRPAFTRSASMPAVVKKSPSLATPRPPLQQIRANSSSTNPNYWGHYNLQRSQTLKGASNLPKETHLLRKKLDRILQNFQETVVEHDKSQQTRFQQVQTENEKLRKNNAELEVENLTYFKELEDCEEHIEELEQQRKDLTEKLTKLRQENTTMVGALTEENAKLMADNESLLRELNEYTDWFHQKDCQVLELQSELQQLKSQLHANPTESVCSGADDLEGTK
jgi:seryl-tRNA synthetase